ncbi:hypothetical protein D4R42_02630 [bacterium]|nr:MAG: hypothetical protein D4R42_02630 [bacterium]
MKISGIYKIQSKIKPERIYVGSAIDCKRRRREHLFGLRNNNHANQKLQNHFNKYGELDLVFSIIVGCSKENLIVYEQFYIDVLNPYFNICKTAGNSLGVKASDETKMKLSESHKGYIWSEESKQRLSESIKGRKLSERAKQNMKGRICSEETRRKISEANKGKTRIAWNKGISCSEETKRKISESKKGHVSPNKGKTMSEESRKKMSDAKKRMYNTKERHPMFGKHPTAWNKGIPCPEEIKLKISNSLKNIKCH